MQGLEHPVESVLGLDELAVAAGHPRQALQEARVDRLVDADHEHPDRRQLLAERLKDLRLVPDLPIRNEHEEPIPLPIGAQLGERLRERRQHLGPPAGLQTGEKLHRAEAVAIGGGHRSRAPQIGWRLDHGVEGEDGEPVLGAQGVDHAGQGAPSSHDFPAAHAPGAIEDEADGSRFCGGAPGRRRHERHQEGAFIG